MYIENFLIPKFNHLVSLMVPPTNSWIPLAYSVNSFQESSFSKSENKILCWEIPPTTFVMSLSLAQIHNKRALQLNLRYRCMPILRKSYLLVCNYPYPATVESKCSEESPMKIQEPVFKSHLRAGEKACTQTYSYEKNASKSGFQTWAKFNTLMIFHYIDGFIGIRMTVCDLWKSNATG